MAQMHKIQNILKLSFGQWSPKDSYYRLYKNNQTSCILSIPLVSHCTYVLDRVMIKQEIDVLEAFTGVQINQENIQLSKFCEICPLNVPIYDEMNNDYYK